MLKKVNEASRLFCSAAALAGLLFFTPSATDAQVTSVLWGVSGEAWDPTNSILRDFTHVGYKGGGAEYIPGTNDWTNAVSVLDYGAVPDDRIDDSDAFIAAISNCPDYSAVFVPNGRYIMTKKIEPQRSHFVLRGEDMYETVLFFPKYLSEVYIEQVGWQPDDTRNTVSEEAFFTMSGGEEKSIESLTIEFREQRKGGAWEYSGAHCIRYWGTSNSWVRNVRMKNFDVGIGVNANYISVINIIADQYNGRSGVGTADVEKVDAFSAILPRNSQYNLYHNIDMTGKLLQPVDNNETSLDSVFSRISTGEMNNRVVGLHGGNARYHLYTELNHPVIREVDDPGGDLVWSGCTYWGVNGELTENTYLTASNDCIYVGYGDDWSQRDTGSFWYEPAAYGQLAPSNLYLAQLEYFGKPLPADFPVPLPKPYEVAGDVIRMPATDDITPGDDPRGMLDTGSAYLRFDLSEATNISAVAHARLRLTLKGLSNTPYKLSAWMVADDSWSENTLTVSNQPTVGSELDSNWILDGEMNPVVEFDVTDFVRSQLVGGDGVVSLYVNRPEGNGFLTSFWSSELGPDAELVIERTASSVPGAPSAPKGISSTPLVGNIMLDWADNPESDVATYNVYRTPYKYLPQAAAGGLITSDHVDVASEADWHVGMMDYRQVYHYWITAVDDHGYESPFSQEFVAACVHPSNSPPAFNTTVGLSGATARTDYSDSLATEASDPESDQLYFMKVSGPDWLDVALDGTLGGMPDLSDVGTNQFTFQVTAIGGSTQKVASIVVGLAADTPAGAPAVPTGFDSSIDVNTVALTWDSHTEADIYGYLLYRSNVSSNYSAEPVTVRGTNTYVDTTVSDGVTYYYALKAIDLTGHESAFSAEISAVPGNPFDTEFTNADAANRYISNPTNWNSGLPVGQTGRIQIDAGYDSNLSHDGYNIYHAAGTVSRANGLSGFTLGSGSAWVMDGPTAAFTTTRGIKLNNAQFTLNEGTANLTDNTRDTNVEGTSARLTVSGGTMTIGRHLYVRYGGTFVMNDGTVTGIDQIALGVGAFELNGGDLSADIFLSSAASTVTFGGTTEGTFTLLVGLGTAPVLNWLPGTKMTMTVGASNGWAEVEWNANHLLYNGQSKADLGKTWAQVTAADGLGTGINFDYDSGTETLSLSSGPVEDTTPPAKPTGLDAAPGNGQVTLSWNANSEPDLAGYSIYRSETSESYGSALTNGLTSTGFVDSTVVNDTTYYYKMTATDTNSNESIKSDEASATPHAPDTTPPAKPTGLTATADDGSVTLVWDANGEGDLAGYSVYRSTTSSNYTAALTNGLTTTNFVDSSVVNGITYYYAISAVDTSDNESTKSTEDSATPTDAPPAKPTGLNAEAGNGSVTLTWDANSEPDLASYSVYRSETSESYGSALTNGLTSPGFVDNSVVNDTTYYYKVTATDTNSNESVKSDEHSATPTDAPPAAPAGLSAVADDGSVTLIWNANSEPDFASYSVYRSTTSSNYTAALTNGLTSTNFVDSTVSNDTTYYYSITATDNGSNESVKSDEVSATPTANVLMVFNYDFGLGAEQDTIASAGLTTYIQSGTSNAVTDQTDAIALDNLIETGGDSAAGFYRSFAGLGPDSTNDFVVTMTVTHPMMNFNEPDIGIHLFGDTASSSYWNTGIYASAEKDRHNSPLSELEIRNGGVNGSLLQSGTIAKDVQSLETTIEVTGTYGTYGSDNLQLVLTVSADGLTNSITTTVDTTGFSATQTGFGVSMTADNNNRYLVDTFSVSFESAASLEGYDQWAFDYGVGTETNDSDADGLNNLYEYGLDGNPTNELDRGTMPVFSRFGNGFLYIHPKRSDDNSLIYTVETRTNLLSGTWTNEGYTVIGTNVTGGTLDFVSNEVDTVESEKFIRLKIGR